MRKKVLALVEPAMLKWARESARFRPEVAAKRAAVSLTSLLKWESGEAKPSVIQARKLAGIYKRPLAAFYLSEPPGDFQVMRDNRRFPGGGPHPLSPELAYAIRRAWDRREAALELFEELGDEPPKFTLSAKLSEDPEEVADRIRSVLGVTAEKQQKLGDRYAAFTFWRNAVEAVGACVFQAARVKPEEARGFSLAKMPLPAVVVVKKDFVRARVFTMLHELTHLALRKDALCDLREDGEALEVFCNRVAGAVLVPEEDLLAEEVVEEHGPASEWSDGEIRALTKRFWGASGEVVLRRLLMAGKTSKEFYKRRREGFRPDPEQQATGGFAQPPHVAVGEAGMLFTRLVVAGYRREKITASDVSDLLSLKLRHLEKVEAIARGTRVAPEELA